MNDNIDSFLVRYFCAEPTASPFEINADANIPRELEITWQVC